VQPERPDANDVTALVVVKGTYQPFRPVGLEKFVTNIQDEFVQVDIGGACGAGGDSGAMQLTVGVQVVQLQQHCAFQVNWGFLPLPG